MTQDDVDTRQPVVTPRSLEGLTNLESVAPEQEGADAENMERALTIIRFTKAVEKIDEETREADPDVLVTARDRDASLLQSRIAEEGRPVEELTPGGLEVKFGPGLEDPWGWATSLIDYIAGIKRHALVRPPDDTVEDLAGDARIAMASDWGSGMYGAPVTAKTIADQGKWDVALHLGDVYYAGTPKEVKERFLAIWPAAAAERNRACNANHEMYSGGYGFFDHIMPAFQQRGSYWAMGNDHWLLVGLDTAYDDHDLDDEQVGWLTRLVKAADGRGILLFSHHQLFSRIGSQGPDLRKALAPLLEARAFTAWYWGHEHDCMVYDPHPDFGLRGRCLGNGGVPAPRRSEVRQAPEVGRAPGVTWHRLEGNDKAPACDLLDGRNPYIKGKEEKFLPHGYMTLEFAGPKLTERMHLPDGTEIWSHTIDGRP